MESQPDTCAQLAASAARVALQLLLGRHDRLSVEQSCSGLIAADTHREFRRTGAALAPLRHGLLDDSVLEGMERDDRKPSLRLQTFKGRLQSSFQLAQLVVDGDAERLEYLARRMTGTSGSRRNRARNDVRQLESGGHGLVLSCRANRLCDTHREFFLAVPCEDFGELLPCHGIAEIGGGYAVLTHAHVERSILVEGKASLGGIDLELTYNEIAYINWQSYRNKQTDDEDELKKDEYEYYTDKDGYSVALVHLNGRQALWYARDRDSAGSDFDRTQRQRIVISTIFAKLKGSDPFTLLGTVFSVSKYLTTNINPISLTGKGFELLFALGYERCEHRLPSDDNYYNDYYDHCGQVLVISDYDLEKERLYSYIENKSE